MSLYLGPFYLRDGDLFVLTAVALILISLGLGITLPLIGTVPFLFLVILFLVARGMLPVASEASIFVVFLTALLASVLVPFSVVLLYIVISFTILKLLKRL